MLQTPARLPRVSRRWWSRLARLVLALFTVLAVSLGIAVAPAAAKDEPAPANGDAAQVGAPAGDHPRIILTAAIVDGLVVRARAGDPAWVALRDRCDELAPLPVWPPTGGSGSPRIDEGYQGEGYFDPLVDLALCYRVARQADPGRATAYGAKGADILNKMSAPSTSPNPLRDSGYGIRFYGVGMAIGYDWLYEALGSSARQQVVNALNRWVAAFDTGGFGREHPQGNYFAGYYAAKVMAAIATEGDNPSSAAMWEDWITRLHGQMVQPYYAAHLAGGGWPEGWNYGPLGSINMTWAVLAAKTGKGVDLLGGSTPFTFPLDHGRWIINATWPTRRDVDDRGTSGARDHPFPLNASFLTTYSGLTRMLAPGDARTQELQQFAAEIRGEAGQNRPPEWQELLFWDSAAPARDYRKSSSYVAPGMGAVFARSGWNTAATWLSFAAAPYTDYPGSGEQYYDQGGLAINRGGTPLLVNAPGAILRNTPTADPDDGDGESACVPATGLSCGDAIYADNYGAPPDGKRLNYNVFYVAGSPTQRWGQLAVEPQNTTTRLVRTEDAADYVKMEGADLQGMYRDPARVAAWNREVTYVRPGMVVVYDRTAAGNASADQWLAWHLNRSVTELPVPEPGSHAFSVTGAGGYAGAVTTVWPQGAATSLTNVYGANKVNRLEVRRGADPSAAQRWLTVFDTGQTAASALRLVASVDGVAGAMQGTRLTGTGDTVVLFTRGEQGSTVTGDIRYAVNPATTTQHILSDLAPNRSVDVAIDAAGNVSVTAGTRFHATAAGMLCVRTLSDRSVVACGTSGVGGPAPTSAPPTTAPPTTAPPTTAPPTTAPPTTAPPTTAPPTTAPPTTAPPTTPPPADGIRYTATRSGRSLIFRGVFDPAAVRLECGFPDGQCRASAEVQRRTWYGRWVAHASTWSEPDGTFEVWASTPRRGTLLRMRIGGVIGPVYRRS